MFASKYGFVIESIVKLSLCTNEKKRDEKRYILIYFHGNIQNDSMANEIFCKNKRFIQLKLSIYLRFLCLNSFTHYTKEASFSQNYANEYIT